MESGLVKLLLEAMIKLFNPLKQMTDGDLHNEQLEESSDLVCE